ncbi:MAG: hypothetical protein K2P81_03125 [Bacteriovoracaceae bacterium]|nr:hypothetical protein [Bacteriovoracaceae bacterium]
MQNQYKLLILALVALSLSLSSYSMKEADLEKEVEALYEKCTAEASTSEERKKLEELTKKCDKDPTQCKEKFELFAKIMEKTKPILKREFTKKCKSGSQPYCELLKQPM